MLNKFTLTFKDEHLESIYQKYLTGIIRKPLLLKLIINSSAFIAISLIQHLIQNPNFYQDTQQLLIFAVNVLQIFFFVFVYKRMPRLIKWVILLYNHILLVYYYNTKVLKPQEQILTVQGIVCLQIINGLTSEFLESVYQIIAFSGCYLIFAIMQDHAINYTLIAQILSAIMILTSAFYQYIKALRSQFQLSNIDNQWEQIFTTLIKDYLIFQYHENNVCFTHKLDNHYSNIENTEDLRKFLRGTKVTYRQNLEQFLFQEIKNNKDNKNIVQQHLWLDKKGISFSIFYGVQTIILLQMSNSSLHQRSKQYSIEKMYQTRFKQLILQITKVMKKNQIKQNLIKMTYEVRKYCLFAYLKDCCYFYKQLDERVIQCKSIVKILTSVFFNKNITFENRINQDFVGCQQLILILLIEIIEKSLSQFVSLSFEKVNNKVFQINVFCLYEAKNISSCTFWASQFPQQIHFIKYSQSCKFLSQYKLYVFNFIHNTLILLNRNNKYRISEYQQLYNHKSSQIVGD